MDKKSEELLAQKMIGTIRNSEFVTLTNQGFTELSPLMEILEDEMDDLVNYTGFSEEECTRLILVTGWSLKQAVDNIKKFTTGSASAAYSQDAIVEGIKNAGLYSKMAENLSSLNTMRGGVKGFKGFVFEEVHAANATVSGKTTVVLNNNGIADFKIISPNGNVSYAQAKLGYNTGNIDFSAYKGQTLVIDKGNTALIKKAKEAGLKVVESDISGEEAARMAKQMQFESKITGSPKSTLVPKTHAAANIVKEAHQVGVKTARTGAQFGCGFSLGSNLVEVLSGEKDVKEAAGDVAIDTAVSAGVGYGTGVAATVIGNSVVGTAISGVAGTATAAIGSTAAGGAALAAESSAIAAGTTAAGFIGSVGTAAVTSTLAAGAAVGSTVAAGTAAVGTAVASTAIGGAAVAAGTAAGTAIAGTAVGGAVVAASAAATGVAVAAGAAVTAVAVAAAPVVAVGAAIGAVFGIGKKLFGR